MSSEGLTSVLSPRSLLLWLGVLAPPAAWGIHLVLGDLVFELGCAPGVEGRALFGRSLPFWGYLQSAVLLGVSLLGGAAGLVAWLRIRRRHEDETSVDRARAFAIAGIASGILYSLLIGYGLFAMVLDPCNPPL